MHTRIGFVIHSGPVPSPATGEAEPGPRAEHGGVGTDSQGQGDHGHGREGLGPRPVQKLDRLIKPFLLTLAMRPFTARSARKG